MMSYDKMSQMDKKIVFMGSPDFAVPVLESLSEKYRIVGVVTQPDRPAGRGRKLHAPPVKEVAKSMGFPIIQPQSLRDREARKQLEDWAPDVIIVTAFGQILKQDILDLPKFGCVNIHASLLPRWRGASPIQAAILAGDARTGVTIMQMEAGLDSGPIIAQRDVPIRPNTTGGELSDQLAHLGARTLLEVLPSYFNQMISPLPQDESIVTYAQRISKSEGALDLNLPAYQLVRKILAFNPWPGAFYNLDGKILKIHHAHAHDTYQCDLGAHYIVNNMPALGTSEGLLVLDEVQPEGKRIMLGNAFLNGLPEWL